MCVSGWAEARVDSVTVGRGVVISEKGIEVHFGGIFEK